MNNKQIIIDAPKGKVIDLEHFSQTGNVKFIDEQPVKIEFPKEWELEEGKYLYYISKLSSITGSKFTDSGIRLADNKNVLPSLKLAEQMLIFTQLITMRERYREIEKLNSPELGEVDWNQMNQNKYCILIKNYGLTYETYGITSQIFSFLLQETRDEFAKNFKDMILQCKDILG